MAVEHQDIRVRLGAYALDAVSGPERDAIARHVASCAECRGELEQLRRVAGTLSLLRGAGMRAGAGDPALTADDETVVALRRPGAARRDAPGRSPRRADDPVLPPVAARGRRAGRRADRRPELIPALAAAAAAAFVLLVGGLATGFEDDPSPDTALAEETGPPPLAFTQAPPGVTGSAQVRDWGWGAQVDLRIAGLAGDRPHSVWLAQADGTRIPAGTFTPTGGELVMTFGAGVPAAGSTALGVSDPDGTTVLLVDLAAAQ